MEKKRVVALEGDGIGIEVVQATCTLLKKAGFNLDITIAPSGEASFKTHGSVLPEETKNLCEKADAILFGSENTDTIMRYLRWGLGNYINMRPAKYYPGMNSPIKDPMGIDFVILRENSEGLYSFAEGDLSLLRERLPDYRTGLNKSIADFGEGKFLLRIITEKGAQRFARFACEFTVDRKKKGHPGNLTAVTKFGIFHQTCGLFKKTIEEEAKKHSQITYRHYNVDDMARRIVRFPKDFDVVATSNLFGDILTDEAAEVTGGLGIAGSACLGGRIPFFESVHGTAPDIAGKNIANPTATILSAKYMLDYLRMYHEAESLEKAVAAVYKTGKKLTPDQGGKATTTEFVEAVLREIK